MAGFNLNDYVTVAERLEQFVGRFPEGSIQTDIIELSDNRVVMRATVYRKPDDERPSIAHSALGIPGATPYTRGSEIENAETSAIGRAIAFLGFDVKRSVASRDEIESKSDSGPGAVVPPAAPVTQPYVAPEEVLLGDASRTGKMVAGTTPCDLQFREDPEGHSIGFTLRIAKDKNIPQVIIKGAIGEAIFQWSGGDPAMLKNKSATVSGRLFELRKDGRADSYRMYVTKIRTEEFELPADVPAEAPSEPLFPPLDEDERAAVAGSLG